MTTIGVVGLILTIILTGIKMWMKKNDANIKRKEAIDHAIDSASNADDIMRTSGELRDK